MSPVKVARSTSNPPSIGSILRKNQKSDKLRVRAMHSAPNNATFFMCVSLEQPWDSNPINPFRTLGSCYSCYALDMYVPNPYVLSRHTFPVRFSLCSFVHLAYKLPKRLHILRLFWASKRVGFYCCSPTHHTIGHNTPIPRTNLVALNAHINTSKNCGLYTRFRYMCNYFA